VRFILHIKSAAAGRAVRRRIDALGAHERVLVAAEWSWRLAAFRNYAGPRGMTTEGGAVLLLRCLLGLRPRARRPLLAPPRRFGIRVLTPRVIACAHAAGQPVIAWVLNGREEIAQALEWGVDAIETDRPDVARAALAEWRSRGGSSQPEVIR
jgi:glycerophosphoryl diester phosphodiesterase